MFIWKDTININDYADFEHEFGAVGGFGKINVACDTNYALWLNGEFINAGQFLNWNGKISYDTLAVKLSQGINKLKITVHYEGVSSSVYQKGKPCLWFEVTAENGIAAQSGLDTRSFQNPNYKVGETTRISTQLAFNFEYNASCTDRQKCKTVAVDGIPSPTPRPVKLLEIKGRAPSKLISYGSFIRKGTGSPADVIQSDYISYEGKDGDGRYFIFDLLREECGFLEIEVETDSETTVDAGYGEHLNIGRVQTLMGDRHFANRYIAKQGRQTFTHYHNRVAGRYIEVHIPGKGKVHYAGIRPAEYPVVYKPSLPVKDNLHREILNVSIRTLHLCMHEHFEDCPWREQALYAVDMTAEALFSYIVFDNPEFVSASLELLADGLQEDGFLKLTAPGEISVTIPTYSFHWIVAVNEFHKHTGQSVDRFLSQIERMLAKYSVDLPGYGERYWHFYEWTDELCGGNLFTETKDKNRKDALYALYLLMAVQSAEELGIKTKHNAVEIAKYINDTFYDKEKGLYRTFAGYNHYCELTQAAALCAGIAPLNLRDTLANGNNGLIPAALSSSLFTFRALLEDEKYHKFVLDRIARDWGSMLKKGATSFWEVIDEDTWDVGMSYCHGWSAVPVYIYSKVTV